MENSLNIGRDVQNYGGNQLTGNAFHGSTLNFVHNSSSDGGLPCLRYIQETNPRSDKLRIEDQKGHPLPGSYRWVLETSVYREWCHHPNPPSLWIRGNPGKGKTMIMIGLIDELSALQPISYFFCESNDKFHNNAVSVLKGLMFSLLERRKDLIFHLESAVQSSGAHAFENSDPSLFYTLKRIFLEILASPNIGSITFLIDALDECVKDRDRILALVLETSAQSTINWILSSRAYPDIQAKLQGKSMLVDLEANMALVESVVNDYILHRVQDFDEDIRAEMSEYLLEKSGGTFLWVHLVFRALEDVDPWEVLDTIRDVPAGLDAYYNRMFDAISQLRPNDAQLCYQILSVVLLAFRPMSILEIAHTLNFPDSIRRHVERKPRPALELRRVMDTLISKCGSFLSVQGEVVHMIHKSAEDFLSDEKNRDLFPESEMTVHRQIGEACVTILKKRLHQDLCNSQAPWVNVEYIPSSEKVKLADLHYAGMFWVSHLKLALEASSVRSSPSNDLATLDPFIKITSLSIDFIDLHILHWLELRVVLRESDSVHEELKWLETMLTIRKAESLVADTIDYWLRFRIVFRELPLQIYVYLAFWPRIKPLHHQLGHTSPQWLNSRSDMGIDEVSYMRVITSKDGMLGTARLAFSPDEKYLAIVWTRASTSTKLSNSDDVEIYHCSTGTFHKVLRSTEPIRFMQISFSVDGEKLFGISLRQVVIWTIGSGHCNSIFIPDSNIESNVTLLPIPGTNKFLRRLENGLHGTWELDVRLSPLALETERLGLGHIGPDYNDHSVVQSISGFKLIGWQAGSPLFNKGHSGSILRLINMDGSLFRVIHVPKTRYFHEVTMALDENLLAVSTGPYLHKDIQIREAIGGRLLYSLRSSTVATLALSFSPSTRNLASAHEDGTVKIWDLARANEASQKTKYDVIKIWFSECEGFIVTEALGTTSQKQTSHGFGIESLFRRYMVWCVHERKLRYEQSFLEDEVVSISFYRNCGQSTHIAFLKQEEGSELRTLQFVDLGSGGNLAPHHFDEPFHMMQFSECGRHMACALNLGGFVADRTKAAIKREVFVYHLRLDDDQNSSGRDQNAPRVEFFQKLEIIHPWPQSLIDSLRPGSPKDPANARFKVSISTTHRDRCFVVCTWITELERPNAGLALFGIDYERIHPMVARNFKVWWPFSDANLAIARFSEESKLVAILLVTFGLTKETRVLESVEHIVTDIHLEGADMAASGEITLAVFRINKPLKHLGIVHRHDIDTTFIEINRELFCLEPFKKLRYDEDFRLQKPDLGYCVAGTDDGWVQYRDRPVVLIPYDIRPLSYRQYCTAKNILAFVSPADRLYILRFDTAILDRIIQEQGGPIQRPS